MGLLDEKQLNRQLRCKSAFGDDSAVSRLIHDGAQVNSTDSSGWTALHWASHNGYTAVAYLLIENGADIRIRGLRGETALHKACYSGRTGLIHYLLGHLNNLRDINCRDNAGRTPLHYACFHDRTEAAMVLIRHGADITLRRDTGEQAVDSAQESVRAALTKLYGEVNKVWLARRAFLIVLVGCGYIPATYRDVQYTDDCDMTALERLRGDVLRNLNPLIFSFL